MKYKLVLTGILILTLSVFAVETDKQLFIVRTTNQKIDKLNVGAIEVDNPADVASRSLCPLDSEDVTHYALALWESQFDQDRLKYNLQVECRKMDIHYIDTVCTTDEFYRWLERNRLRRCPNPAKDAELNPEDEK